VSWCDKLAATPTVGFKLSPYFHPSDTLLSTLAPVLSGLAKDEKIPFSIERQESFAVVLSTDEGFQYGLDHSKINVSFVHRMRARPVSAGPPVMELVPPMHRAATTLFAADNLALIAACATKDQNTPGRYVVRNGALVCVDTAKSIALPPNYPGLDESLLTMLRDPAAKDRAA